MSNWFEVLAKTDEKFELSKKIDTQKFIPSQFFDWNLISLIEFFSGWSKTRNLELNVLWLSDGVSKFFGSEFKNVDDAFGAALTSHGIKHEHINAAEYLNIKSEEIHASVLLIPPLIELIKSKKCSCICVLGSGSLTDLIKESLARSELNLPFVVVPTALTVTAFTSAFAVLEESGAKRTRRSRNIDLVLWWGEVLSCAPVPFSRAGYGDLLARFVAYADWKLAHFLNMCERYDVLAFELMEPFAEALKSCAGDFKIGPLSLETTEKLAACLSMAGIAMSVSGETTPLSGFEHTISHALDFLRISRGEPLVLHGEQVALATLASARCWDWVLSLKTEDLEFRSIEHLEENEVLKFIERLIQDAPNLVASKSADELSDAAQEFCKDYSKKSKKWQIEKDFFREKVQNWPFIVKELKKLVVSAEVIEGLLLAAGLPCVPENTLPSTTALDYRWAVRFSPFVRARFCVSDFLFWIGEDPAFISAI